VGAFGERLKREREQRKITLDEVALATKISARMLRALEEEKFDLLPGGIFSKGFVRAFARHLGISEDQAVADYMEAFRASHPEAAPVADPEAEGRKILEQRALRVQQERPHMERIPWGKAAVALMLLAFGAALWSSYSRHSKPNLPVTATSKKSVAKTPHQMPTRAQGSDEEASTPASRLTLASEKKTGKTEDVFSNPADQAASSGSFRVVIRAREDSWIQIIVDGKEPLEETMQADSQRSISAHSQVVIKAGNTGGLDFWFNGQKLPAQGGLDEVKILTFDSAGLTTPAPRIEPVASTEQR
jgi:cytoskeleton protein RodZ